MKSFKKLRDFARQGGKNREKQSNGGSSNSHYQASYGGGYLEPTEDAELVTKGMKDVRGTQKKYESLASLSAEVSSWAHGLSTAVHEMASYFAAPGVLDDQDIGKVFKLVGEVQFEISKSLELYASHVTQTVTAPTENLIVELQNVMETKKQYDVKRQSLDSHRMRIARGRSKTGRGDSQDEEQLEVVREQFEEVSRFLGDRLLSLRQGRSRSLISHAARHHAAQMKLFSKGLTSLHGIEPHMKQVTQELNIDRRLSSADIDESEVGEDEAASDIEVLDDDGSYFDDADEEMEHHHPGEDDLGSESSENGGNARLNMSREWSSYMASGSDRPGTSGNEGLDSPLPRWVIKGSKSAPTSPLATSDGLDEVDRSPPLYVSAVLPPTRSPSHLSDKDYSGILHGNMRAHDHNPSTSEQTSPRQHSVMPANSPLVYGRTTKMGVPMTMFPPFDHSLTTWPMPLPLPTDPPPMLNFEAPSLPSTPRGFVTVSSVAPKKRYSYSGPLTSSAKPVRSHSSVVPSSGPLRPFPCTTGKSWKLSRSPSGQANSRRSSPAISPSKISPPRISELHKLPPPPLSTTSSPIEVSSGLIPHSAPLHRHEASTLHASPLPPPPLGNVSRSLSMSGATGKSQKQKQHHQRSKAVKIAEVEEGISSPLQPKLTSDNGHSGNLTTHKNLQIGNKSSSLRRSVSGCGVSFAAPLNGALNFSAPGRTPSVSTENKMWRLNTMLHSSPSLTVNYTVESPPYTSPADGQSRPQPAGGNDFELGRRSVDVAVPGNSNTTNKHSKWSKWRSFSAHDKDDLSVISHIGTEQVHGFHTRPSPSSSPRHGTVAHGVLHV